MAWFARKQDPVEQESEAVVLEAPTLPAPPAVDAAGLRSAADHSSYLLSLVEPLPAFGMPLLEAWNQVMTEDIDSLVNVPAASTAKVAGYAVRAFDLTDDEGRLSRGMRLVGADVERLPEGGAAVVAPGDALPPGANTVLPTSFATIADGRLELIDRVAEGEYVRAAGEHLPVGTRLLSEGDVLGERAIGLLASAGIEQVLVRPRPRVVVLGSGERLADHGGDLRPGETVDANSYLISAAAKAAGATVFRVAVHTNDAEAIRQTLSDQLIRADLVISTTGGKREDYEAVAGVLADLGLVDSADVAMSPGRTHTFALVGEDRVPVLMLPGNPVSAYVTFQAFARPLIRRLMGAATEPRTVRAIAGGTMRSTKGQLHLLRGSVRTEGSIRHVDQVTMPHALGELAASNALIVLDGHVELVRAGEQVPVWILDED
ncbi:MAG TPA: molybdopterin molybdotransferase MoeA [Arachnia sp.]|jgi:molybdopterin molybdotransferase|nr:molybdopterin molybdotransferase MoeA [Propionibacteriaceae bacterium]HOA26373.1 molybdopterin molybdotransferase MoeA [Arachnia sp.]HQD21511.1 molybdopterin molybdotransferase MoeA [Arachnia sp.]